MFMNTEKYQHLINEGIKELPESALAEIADFVYFVRLKTASQISSEIELYALLLELEMKQLSSESLNHLEEEFANYDKQYPRE
jgi:hypothetical protein